MVATDAALRGRDLLKQSSSQEEITLLLVERGRPPLRASTLAGTAAAVVRVAYGAWLHDPSPATLAESVESVLADLLDELTPAHGRSRR